MKAKYFSYSLAILLTAVAGCTKESSDLQIEGKQKIVISAGYAETKTFGIETIKFNTSDKLSVFDSEGANNQFAQPSEDPKASVSATFEGEITSGSQPKYVVYPYEANAKILNDVITTTIYSSYNATNKNSVLNGMNLSIGGISTQNDAYTATLKNVCGIVGIKIPSEVIGVKKVKLTTNESLAGNVSIAYNDGDPEVVSKPDGSKSIEFSIPANDGLQYNDCSFYFSLVPGTYTGIRVTITLLNGQTKEFSSNNQLVVKRGSRIMMKELTLADVQDVPSGDITLTLKFDSTIKDDSNVTQCSCFYVKNDESLSYLPKTSGTAITTGATYYYDQEIDGQNYSFPFYLCANNVNGGSMYYRAAAVEYNGTKYVKDLRISGSSTAINCYIKTPAIPGKKLTRVGFRHAYEKSSAQNQRLRIAGTLGDETDNYFSILKGSCIASIASLAYTDITTSTVGQSYYIYHKHDYMNLRELVLEYTAE